MTLMELIEAADHLRQKTYRDAHRLTIELEAYQDVLNETFHEYHHVEERAIYNQAYNLAVDVQQQEQPQDIGSDQQGWDGIK